jgi:hypothetical protein
MSDVAIAQRAVTSDPADTAPVSHANRGYLSIQRILFQVLVSSRS